MTATIHKNSSKNNLNGLLQISGQDAKRLLQGQLTCDLEQITADKGSFGAHCNPEGRIVSLFYVFLFQDSYYLLMPRSMVNITITVLKKYALFYKSLSLTEVSDQLPTLKIFPHLPHHVPMIYPETSGKFLPHELNLHRTNAISFDKGCYTGQEIIARIHYRGKLKKRFCSAIIFSETLPKAGDEIYALDHQTKISCGVVIDTEILTHQQHKVFMVINELHAKENHLFLDSDHQHFFTDINDYEINNEK